LVFFCCIESFVIFVWVFSDDRNLASPALARTLNGRLLLDGPYATRDLRMLRPDELFWGQDFDA
jgi:hypothetical protein